MIAKLTGILDDFGPDWAVIDVHGVGYLVFCSGRTLTALGIRGDACTVYTEMQVSETDMRLIGFTSAGERAWFKLLTAVQGVGSKVALAILSALTVEELQRACGGGDSAMVARANGVGPKLAARIVNELKDKAGAMPSSPLSAGSTPNTPLPAGNAAADVVSALQNLGFKPQTAIQATERALEELGEEAGVPALIRVALKKATG